MRNVNPKAESEAFPPLQAGVLPCSSASHPGKDSGHFCIAPLDPALPGGDSALRQHYVSREHAGQLAMKPALTSRWGRAFILVSATCLLFSVSCAKVAQLIQSGDPYHTETYKRVCEAWTREARIHRGLELELIVSATYKSEVFRQTYAEEYAKAYRLTPETKTRFIEDQLEAAIHGHEFLMATFVPEDKWDDFDQANSVWKIYLVNDQNERVVPVEVRKVRENDAVTPHFFPYVTPWKSVYKVRFPRNTPTTEQPIIEEDTKDMKLIITSVLGTAELGWNLK